MSSSDLVRAATIKLLPVLMLMWAVTPAPTDAAPRSHTSTPTTFAPAATAAPGTTAIGVVMRPRLELTPDDAQWRMQMVRPRLRGQVGSATWFVQTELAGTANVLLDARIRLPITTSVKLTLGRFITPFSRAFLTPVPKLAFPDFASPVGDYRVGRQLGGMLTATLFQKRLKLFGAVFLMDPASLKRFRPVFMGRATFAFGAGMAPNMAPYLTAASPIGATLGVSAYNRIGARTPLDANAAALRGAEPGDVTVGLDLSVRHGPLACVAEGFARLRAHAAARKRIAAYAQCQASLFGSDWEGGVRATVPDMTGLDGAVAEALISHYLRGQNLKVQMRYRLVTAADSSVDPSHQVTVQLQLHTWMALGSNL